MTESPNATGLAGFSRVEGRAAAALAADFARRTGPASGLLVGVTGPSEVLSAAIEALGAAAELTVVAGTAADEVRAHVTAASASVAARVRVVESLSEADPADSVIVA